VVGVSSVVAMTVKKNFQLTHDGSHIPDARIHCLVRHRYLLYHPLVVHLWGGQELCQTLNRGAYPSRLVEMSCYTRHVFQGLAVYIRHAQSGTRRRSQVAKE
jgi:hypothetical protein